MAFPVRVHALAAVSLLAFAGCESPQDPEPIEKTLPTAIGIAGLWAVVMSVLLSSAIRWIARRRDASLVRRPVAVALLVVSPVIVASVPVVLGFAWVVAFGYTEPTTSLFSWDDTVAITTIFAGVSAVAVVLALAMSLLAAHSNPTVVAVGQVLLAVPACAVTAVAVTSDLGLGSLITYTCALPWTVAFVLTWFRRPTTSGPYTAAT